MEDRKEERQDYESCDNMNSVVVIKFTLDIEKYIHNTSILVALNTCTINGVGRGFYTSSSLNCIYN